MQQKYVPVRVPGATTFDLAMERGARNAEVCPELRLEARLRALFKHHLLGELTFRQLRKRVRQLRGLDRNPESVRS